jgi:thiol-disulfide isomerase/thioredoxin
LRPNHAPRLTRRGLLAALALAALAPAASQVAAAPEKIPATPAWPLLKDLHGKVVLVDFWASWCAPCLSSFPWMDDLQKRHGQQGLVVVAVNLDQDRALAEAFLRKTAPQFRIEFDAQGALAKQFGVRAMPTSFLIDRSGKLRITHQGFRGAQRAERERQIRQLLEEHAT